MITVVDDDIVYVQPDSHIDIDIVGEGIQRLHDALTTNRVTLAAIEREYDSDRRLLEAREFWGDKSDDQRLITRGIRLRQIARRVVIDEAKSALAPPN